jgi:hypothetical protein
VVNSRVVNSEFTITTSQNCKLLVIPFEAFSKICTIVSGGTVSLMLDAMVQQHKKEANWCSTQIHLLNTKSTSSTVQSHSLGSLFSQQAAFIECTRCNRLKCWSTSSNCTKRAQKMNETSLQLDHIARVEKGTGMARLHKFPPLDGGGPDKDNNAITEEDRKMSMLSFMPQSTVQRQKDEGTAAAKEVAEGQRTKKKKRRGSVVEMLSAIAGLAGGGKGGGEGDKEAASDNNASTKDLSMALQIKKQMTDKRIKRATTGGKGKKAKARSGSVEGRRGSVGSIAKSLSNALGFNMFK